MKIDLKFFLIMVFYLFFFKNDYFFKYHLYLEKNEEKSFTNSVNRVIRSARKQTAKKKKKKKKKKSDENCELDSGVKIKYQNIKI